MILPFQSERDVVAATGLIRQHLAGDGLLGYPTETVYGLGSAPREAPVERLSRLKGRPPGKPFLLLVTGRTMAEEWGLVFNAAARALSDAFWPGPLTLVLQGGEGRLPDSLRGGEGGFAVRFTSHPLIARLIGELGYPLTSTSANLPGKPTAPGAAGLARLFSDAVNDGTLIVLDGGVLGNVPPSTLVDCTKPVPSIIREGALPRALLRQAVGRLAP